MAEGKTFGEMTINEAIAAVAKLQKDHELMDKKIDMLSNAFHQWRLTMEECAKAREERKAKAENAHAEAVLEETNARR